MNKKKLQRIIEILVENTFLHEKEELGIDLSNSAADNKNSTSDSTDKSSDSKDDNKDPLSGDTDSTDNTGTDGDTPDEAGDLNDTASNLGGTSKGGFGGFGGGSSSSSSFDSPDDEDSSNDSESNETPEENLDKTIPEDPVQSTIDLAIKLSREIGDNQIILNSVKSNMQRYFSDFNEAIPIIQGLWDTNDPNLKIVARKLIMFIHGE